jgi:hypothetical protein
MDIGTIAALGQKECIWIVPPTFVAMMTGARYAKILGDFSVTLHYEDGAEETAKDSRAFLESWNGENFFELVGHVQK